MKKLIIPASLILIAACVQPFIKHKSNATKVNSQPTFVQVKNIPTKQIETTHSFTPQFSALNIPDEMKQKFRINPKASQVIVGKSGTMILIPDHAFVDGNGNVVTEKVSLELVEGIKNADIIKMNLGTMSDQGPLETGGMVYVNAFSEKGDTLKLADGKKLDVEIPTDNKKAGMKLWDGIVKKDGSVFWTNPQPLKNTLRAVLPVSLTFKNNQQQAANKKKVLVPGKMRESTVFAWWNAQEKSWNPIGQLHETKERSLRPISIEYGRTPIMNGIKFAWWNEQSQSWVLLTNDDVPADTNNITLVDNNGDISQTINLADAKFFNTNIATAEFRSRLPFINQCCDSRVMLCYTENPKRDLWKSDEAAADTLEKEGCALADLFRQFSKLKQGKVDPSDPNTSAALDAARETAIKNYSRNVRESANTFELGYHSSYSFAMTTLGWSNIDGLVAAARTKTMLFNVRVENESENEKVQTTLIVPGRGIFLSGYKRPNGNYSFTHGECEIEAQYPEGEEAYVLARSGRGENLRFGLKKIILGTNNIEPVVLHSGTEDELSVALGNEPATKKDAPETAIDDWYTRALKSGGGCLCGGMAAGPQSLK